jgi:hypothetical protein
MSEPIAREAPAAAKAASSVAGSIAAAAPVGSAAGAGLAGKSAGIAAPSAGGGDTWNITIQGSNKSAEELFNEFTQLMQSKRTQKGYRSSA